MSERLPSIGWQTVVDVLERDGWVVGRDGPHVILHKPGVRDNVSVPRHNPVKRGTLASILRVSGIDRKRFFELLRKR